MRECPPIFCIKKFVSVIFFLYFWNIKTIIDYYTKNPQAKSALGSWYQTTLKAEWDNFADIRQTFATVSQVGEQHYVFNIKGNDYRLVVVIKFTPKCVYIRFVGTHAEYDKITDIKKI